MVLYRKGYYKEMPHADESDPSMLDNIGKKVEHKEEICKYLQSGMVLAACGEVVKDVLHPEKGIAGTPDDMTDGRWIWPGDLAYYVKNYDLRLSKDFTDYMADHNWIVPEIIDIDYDTLEVK
ncbi:hypothetical protein [[Clostridium] aminophilum]|uniref:Uncharacterized protein n=1 Tax=[Clostridium] aminophilum TaxID=1526 RepID=A0A1I6KLL8_9FIRM|nr:hypothetical protein [[Clostridium] aminophilum]SFR92162.1 hypothetical protein SAMN02910262_02648 [[Clostridium] aminophilum]